MCDQHTIDTTLACADADIKIKQLELEELQLQRQVVVLHGEHSRLIEKITDPAEEADLLARSSTETAELLDKIIAKQAEIEDAKRALRMAELELLHDREGHEDTTSDGFGIPDDVLRAILAAVGADIMSGNAPHVFMASGFGDDECVDGRPVNLSGFAGFPTIIGSDRMFGPSDARRRRRSFGLSGLLGRNRNRDLVDSEGVIVSVQLTGIDYPPIG